MADIIRAAIGAAVLPPTSDEEARPLLFPSLHCNTLVNEYAGHVKLTVLSLPVILGFPVGNGRTEEFLYISCSCLL